MFITVLLANSANALRRSCVIISCLLLGPSYYIQAQLTLTAGQSVSLNTTVSYPSVSISGANTSLAIGASGNVSVTGGFTWLDQPSFLSIAAGGILTIDGNLQGDGNTSTNNNYYPCITTSAGTTQAMIIDCKGTLTVNGNLAAGSTTKRFKNWVFLHVDSGAIVTLNGNDNVLGPRGIIYVHKGGTLHVTGANFLVEYAYSRIEIESGGTMNAVNLTINGNGSTVVTSACATNPTPYDGIATTTNPPYTSLNVQGDLTVSGNLSINDAAVSTSSMTSGTGHFTVANSGNVTVGGNFMNGSAPTATGQDTVTVNGTLTVAGNTTNNSILNIGSTGVMTVNGSTGLLNNTGSVYGVSVITVDGKLNVAANTTNNGLINIDATGFIKVFGNLFNNTISTYGVAIITVINDLYVQGNITSNDIIRAICPPGDTTSYVAWGSAWISGAHDTVQNYSSGVKYYTGLQVPPGNALNLCTGNPSTLAIVLAIPYTNSAVNRYPNNSPIVNLRPSVTSEPWLKVFVNRPNKGHCTLLITDLAGRTLVHQKVEAAKGDNIFPLDISRLKPGLYYVQVFTSDGLRKTLMAEKR